MAIRPTENPELTVSAAGAVRSVTLQIMDSSDTTFNINTFSLTGGKWDPTQQPQLGQSLGPGQTLTYINFTDAPFTGVGGTISLAPVSGGLINITWAWNYGSPLQSGFVIQGTTLNYILSVGGQNTPSPTVQISIAGLAKEEERASD